MTAFMNPQYRQSFLSCSLPLAFVLGVGCSGETDVSTSAPTSTTVAAVSVDQSQARSAFPVAVEQSKVGSYARLTKSGGGYFYDDVLEYRVWIDSADGDFYKAFASFEQAHQFSSETPNAEKPLVLVLQEEHVNEAEPGVFEHVKERRITEWRVEWLDGNKRHDDSIPGFLRKHAK